MSRPVTKSSRRRRESPAAIKARDIKAALLGYPKFLNAEQMVVILGLRKVEIDRVKDPEGFRKERLRERDRLFIYMASPDNAGFVKRVRRRGTAKNAPMFMPRSAMREWLEATW